MNLNLSRTLAALLTAVTLTFGASAALAGDGQQLLLKPSDDNHETHLEEQLPKMGFVSQFIYGKGAYVTGVLHGTEAAKLGLEEGDIVVGVNGQKLVSKHTWSEILHDVVYHQTEEEDVLHYSAPQSGGQQLMLQPLKPDCDQIITLHIRDWRTGHIAIRKTNLKHWD